MDLKQGLKIARSITEDKENTKKKAANYKPKEVAATASPRERFRLLGQRIGMLPDAIHRGTTVGESTILTSRARVEDGRHPTGVVIRFMSKNESSIRQTSSTFYIAATWETEGEVFCEERLHIEDIKRAGSLATLAALEESMTAAEQIAEQQSLGRPESIVPLRDYSPI